MADNLARIEDKLDKATMGGTEISMQFGGIHFQSMMELFEMAKLMAISKTAVPKHLRENPGACLAVCVQALEWRMSPFSIAQKSYEVNDRIAYESQLVVALINARAPLKERLRYKFEGEGVEMRCTVSGLLKGEATPLEYESPKIKDIKVKNSPLWTGDPKQQLGYYSARAWARRHTPETILGIYSEDELRDGEIGPEHARDITPAKPDVGARLAAGKKARKGFHPAVVDDGLAPPTTAGDPDEGKPTTVSAQNVILESPPPGTLNDAQRAILSEHLADNHDEAVARKDAEVRGESRKKIAAIENADTKADVNALLDGAREYLRYEDRPDLLGDLLAAANSRLKKLKV